MIEMVDTEGLMLYSMQLTTYSEVKFMHWRKMKIHLKPWANSHEEEGVSCGC